MFASAAKEPASVRAGGDVIKAETLPIPHHGNSSFHPVAVTGEPARREDLLLWKCR